MSLFRKMFGEKASVPPTERSRPADSQDQPSEDDAPQSRSAPRREVVHVVLRETMRRHGIPHDWIECRTMSMVQSNRSTGSYVTFTVRGGQDRLLPFVPSFQASFRDALQRFDPRASDWLRGLTWEFADGSIADSRAAALGADSSRGTISGAELQPQAGAAQNAAAPASGAAEQPSEEDELQKDLAALYAIRDAAIATRPGDLPTQRGPT